LRLQKQKIDEEPKHGTTLSALLYIHLLYTDAEKYSILWVFRIIKKGGNCLQVALFGCGDRNRTISINIMDDLKRWLTTF
jgi:hypothetical protein